jgi:antagonist of KipI
MPLQVLSPGLFSLPVGVPRPGRRALGVPPGGPADAASFALGNALLGNPPHTPAVEVSLLGPTLRATADTGCVLSGAPFQITRDGDPLEPNHTFTLRAGQTLRIAGRPSGCRAYLCVPGGFTLPPVPTPLAAGDVLACAESRVRGRSILPFVPPTRRVAPLLGDLPHKGGGGGDWPSLVSRRLRDATTPTSPLVGEVGSGETRSGWGVLTSPTLLRVLPGPQRDWFPDDAFFTRTWAVGEASNRMGVRLTGEPIAKRAGELVSEPVNTGAVQVTHDGRPIILGVDGQTIGGYPKVAHVIRADLDRIGQLRPGAVVQFELVSLETVDVLNRERQADLGGWLARLAISEGVVV